MKHRSYVLMALLASLILMAGICVGYAYRASTENVNVENTYCHEAFANYQAGANPSGESGYNNYTVDAHIVCQQTPLSEPFP